MFKPLTDEDREDHPIIITLASAGMGRHFAPLFIAAADHIASLQARAEAAEAKLAAAERLAELLDRALPIIKHRENKLPHGSKHLTAKLSEHAEDALTTYNQGSKDKDA